MNLRSITEHLKGKSHTNILENRNKSAEIHKGTSKILQARVDIIILCQRTISPELVQYIMYAVRAAASVSIAIRSLEDL